MCLQVMQASVRIGSQDILAGITVDFRRGERVAVVGANGAGKSTFLRLLAGAIQPSNGEIDRGDPSETNVALVWQGLALVQRLSVLENVLIGAVARCRSPGTWWRIFPVVEVRRANTLLERLGIAHLAEERVDRLSGGERQRAAIGRALMQTADFLVADEPTASLDWSAARDVARLFSGLALSEGITTIAAVHDVSLLEHICDRVIGLARGRIAFDLPRKAVGYKELAAIFPNSALA